MHDLRLNTERAQYGLKTAAGFCVLNSRCENEETNPPHEKADHQWLTGPAKPVFVTALDHTALGWWLFHEKHSAKELARMMKTAKKSLRDMGSSLSDIIAIACNHLVVEISIHDF